MGLSTDSKEFSDELKSSPSSHSDWLCDFGQATSQHFICEMRWVAREPSLVSGPQ